MGEGALNIAFLSSHSRIVYTANVYVCVVGRRMCRVENAHASGKTENARKELFKNVILCVKNRKVSFVQGKYILASCKG